MLPVNNIIVRVPDDTCSGQTTDLDHARRLLGEWKEWAQSAPPGNGERRDRAVENLKDCLENKTDWLNLSGFNLTTLPENLPASLRVLDVSNNKLTALTATLPALLQFLCVMGNRLTALPEALPAALWKLNVCGNRLTSLPETLPASLWKLDAADNRLTALPEVLPASLEHLDVTHNRLTSLPETLPSSLWNLDVMHNRLQALPEALPASLQNLNISDNRFVSLPDRLPASLWRLNITNNQLTALPKTLPAFLEELYAGLNRLTCLPETLPAALRELNVTHNQLVSLPETLPASLRELNVSHNQLVSLTRALPASLRELNVSDNQLISVPATLPTSLWELNVSNNRLISLPEALPSSLRQVDVSYNRLTSLPVNLSTSRNLNSLNVTGNPLVRRLRRLPADFLGTIAHWTGRDNARRWKTIQSEDGAMVFADFLHKLHDGNNKLHKSLHGRVREWLSYLAAEENSELRRQTFSLAEEAVTSCVDRAAFYFNRMYWLMKEDRAIKSGVDAAQLIKMIRSGFRLQALERIAAAHAQRRRREAPGFDEEIEIYLAYEYRLRKPLSLPVYTALQFTELAGLTEQDIEAARTAVLSQEKTDFLRYLVTESAVWRQRLQSWNKGKTAAVEADYLEGIASADFSAAVDRELKENGLPVDDSDARRAVCKKIAEAWLFAARLRLTRDYLAAHEALPCLAPFRGEGI